ncbi:MAG: hypothetical protein KF819_22795 [Labilithrix sp.]|nr:hypothetical protein [Labilithrix sp.]
MTAHHDSMTMLEARTKYFADNGFGDDGGYGDAWVDFKLGPVPFPFPNSPQRLHAVRFHDLHHVLTGYATDTIGEFEIAAWEIAAGCKGFVAAWLLNLGGIAGGLVSAPRRTYAAFVRGRRSRTLYGEPLEALLHAKVGDVRRRYIEAGVPTAGLADAMLFALTAIVGFTVALALFAIFVPLVPVGLLMSWLRARSLKRAENA